jgi:hypothetical protein
MVKPQYKTAVQNRSTKTHEHELQPLKAHLWSMARNILPVLRERFVASMLPS